MHPALRKGLSFYKTPPHFISCLRVCTAECYTALMRPCRNANPLHCPRENEYTNACTVGYMYTNVWCSLQATSLVLHKPSPRSNDVLKHMRSRLPLSTLPPPQRVPRERADAHLEFRAYLLTCLLTVAADIAAARCFSFDTV